MLVITRVPVGAHPEEAHIKEPQRKRQDPAVRELTIFGQRPRDVLPELRLDSAERLHVAEFELVAIVPPGWVVPILLSPTTVDARRLEMRVRVGGDPHVPPGGRNRERPDPAKDSRITDGLRRSRPRT